MEQLQKAFEGHNIRVIAKDGEARLVAADLAKALEYKSTSSIYKLVDPNWKGVAEIQTPGGPQRMTVLHEQGVYQVLGSSTKDAATPFQKWLYGKVLVEIRRTGGYNANARPKAPIDRALDLKAQIQSLRTEIR